MQTAILGYGVVCAMGTSVDACKDALFSGRVPPLASRFINTGGDAGRDSGRKVPVFEVPEIRPLPSKYAKFDCRNNRLAYQCFSQISETVSQCQQSTVPARVGVVVGSSTSGLAASELAYQTQKSIGSYPDNYRFDTQHAMGSLSRFIAELCEAKGPAYTVSTACSSAAKAMLSARGLIEANVCDIVITGGVDSLCDLTVHGFASLGQLSDQRMNPLSEHRQGLNIGEGGALFVLSKEGGNITLLGGGESMDAYHMSAPRPDGSGAALAMTRALSDAGVTAKQVAYVNLHGTATKANDAMESSAVYHVTPNALVSSSKPFFGHCLGAAGAVEAAMCCISLMDEAKRLPPHIFDGRRDATLPPMKIATEGATVSADIADYCYVSNSFAFGGSNCALVLGKAKGGVR